MGTYALCRRIREMVMNRAAEVMCYVSWSAEFASKEIKEIPASIRGDKSFKPVQPADLSSAEMDDLGFGLWEEGNPMRLIPLWLFPFLADEIYCGSISAEARVIKKSEMDNDNRMGFLAYGVIPKP